MVMTKVATNDGNNHDGDGDGRGTFVLACRARLASARFCIDRTSPASPLYKFG